MLSKCCCCVPLRTGSIVLAILGILGGIATFAQSGSMSSFCHGSSFVHCHGSMSLFWFNVIEGIFYFLAYGALLFGAIKYNDKAVLFNLVLTAIIIVLEIVGAIIVLSSIETFVPELASCLSHMPESCDQIKAAAVGTAAGICIVSSVLNGYFWVCNYSFYKELKGGSSNPA